MSHQSLSQVEQEAGITEQCLIGVARDIIWSYLRGQRERVSAEPLITEFVRVTSNTHPNPERMGCPGTKILTEMAASERTDEILLKHFEECGPCLQEYSELLDIASSSKS